MDQNGFSIVVPTFNREKNIERLLSTFLNISYRNYEIIICDDGSVDNTFSIFKKYESLLPIKYLFQKNWGGPAKPRNLGILNAKFEWVAFIDSDDLWTNDKLDVCNQYINDYPLFDCFFHLMGLRFNSGNVIKSIGYFKPSINPQKNFYRLLYYGNLIALSSFVVRRSFLLNVNMFSEDRKLIAIEDYDLYLKLLLSSAKFKLINRRLGYYFVSNDSISKSFNKSIYQLKYLHSIYFKKGILLNEKRLNYLLNYKMGCYYVKFKWRKSVNHFLYVILFSFDIRLALKSLIKLFTR